MTRLLDQSAAQTVVIAAPAGYGKTRLVSEWLHDKPLVAWYQATAASADIAAFSTGIGDAVASFLPGCRDRLRQRLRVAEAPLQNVRPLAELLADDLACWPDDAWLVVDDYHLVADSAAVEQFIDWLLTLSPVRLVVTTRRRPSWASARRVLHGEITEITTEQLAMTDEEARNLLGAKSTPEVRALVAQAQGWPALIGLARLSASFELPRSQLSGALFRYFAEEVIRREPADVQQLMLAAAVPSAVDQETLSDLAEVGGKHRAIDRLLDEGLLHEAEDGRLRFHPLLRDFLRWKLKATNNERFCSLCDRAITSAVEHARWDEAIELALEIGDTDRAAEMVAEVSSALLDSGRIETIERWLAACGPVAMDAPSLVLAKAEVLLRRGELAEAAALAHDAARRLPSDDVRSSHAWHVAGRAFNHVSQYALALECLSTARETAKTDDESSIACATLASIAAELGGEELDRLVMEIERLNPASVDARLNLAASKIILAASGRTLAGSWKRIEPFVPLAKYATNPMVRAFFLDIAAYVATARADYRQGLDLTEEALRTSDAFRLGPIRRASSLCCQAAAAIGIRRFAQAETALKEAARLGAHGASHIAAQASNLRLELLIAQGAPRRGLGLNSSGATTAAPRAYEGERAGLVALAAAAVGEMGRSRIEGEKAVCFPSSIEALFYSRFAGVIRRMGSVVRELIRDEAINVFWEAAEAEILGTFVTAYRAYPPLLRLVAEDESAFPIVARVVRNANDQQLAREVGVVVTEEEPDERLGSLTRREQEVLRLMSDGLSNAEIAKRLFISESTAKVHVHHILEKLGARSRLHAVLMYRESGDPSAPAAAGSRV